MENNKKKSIIIISIITTILVLIIGVSYAAFYYQKTSGNSELIMGDIYMHYKENNQLVLSDARPSSFKLNTLKLPKLVTTTNYTINSVMKEQTINTLSRCIGYYSSFFTGALDVGSTWEGFCKGLDKVGGLTLEEYLNDGQMPTILTNDGYSDLFIQEGDTYKPNPIMQAEEINELIVCINTFATYTTEEGEDVVGFCKGTSTIMGITFQSFIKMAVPPLEDWKNTNIVVQEGDIYKPNPIIQTQIINELEACISFNPSIIYDKTQILEIKKYCQGESNGYKNHDFQTILTGELLGDRYSEEQKQKMLELNIISASEDILPEVEYSYTSLIVNPNMEGEVLENCKTIVADLQTKGYATRNIEGFCQGTVPIFNENNVPKLIIELATDIEFLQGDGHLFLRKGVILPETNIDIPYFEFEISGKNTYTKKDIWYDIVLSYGDNHASKTERIRDDLLRFTLTEVTEDNTEIVVVDNAVIYNLENNERLYVETIPKNTMDEINKTYRLYVTISDETVICGGEEVENCDYYIDGTPNWNDVFASIKVNVTGDFNEKELHMYLINDFKKQAFEKSDTLFKDEDGSIYLSGGNSIRYDPETDAIIKEQNKMIEYNYVLYSGILWRITAIYPDGTMKLVTDDVVTTMAWDSTDGKYKNSSVYIYLNNDFLNTLDNYENIIVTDYNWDTAYFVTSLEISDSNYVSAPVGLLNSYEYSRSYQNLSQYSQCFSNSSPQYSIRCSAKDGYLIKNSDSWWLLNDKDFIKQNPFCSGNDCEYLSSGAAVNSTVIGDKDYDSGGFISATYTSQYGVRPSIVLKSDVLLSDGNGSYDSPYILVTNYD